MIHSSGMLKYYLNNALYTLFAAFAISVVIIAGMDLLPGDMARIILGQDTPQAALYAFERELRLDQWPWERYINWLMALLHGDMGKSLVNRSNILETIVFHIRNSTPILIATVLLSVLLSLLLIRLATGPSPWLRLIALSFLHMRALHMLSIGIFLAIVLSIELDLLPLTSQFRRDASLGQWIQACALPVATLLPIAISLFMSLFSNRHDLKGHHLGWVDAMAIILNGCALWLFIALIPVEILFQYPGIGTLIVNAAVERDIPTLQNAVIVLTWLVLFFQMLVKFCKIYTEQQQRDGN